MRPQNPSLKDRAVIVSLSISQWEGRKLDRRASSTVAAAHGNESRAGNYSKKLLPGAPELETIKRLTREMRDFFHSRTLPWMSDGARIISSDAFLTFSNDFRKRREAIEAAVAEFVAAYPALREDARAKLADLFNEADYPSAEAIASRFRCALSVYPVPARDDFRVDLPAEALAEFDSGLSSAETEAMQDAWKRLREKVACAVERLSSPDAVFRDSLIENLREIVEILPGLNVMGDQALEETRAKVETRIAGLEPQTLREDAKERASAAQDLASILNSMGAYMGAGGSHDAQ